jgi:hypothetical protein
MYYQKKKVLKFIYRELMWLCEVQDYQWSLSDIFYIYRPLVWHAHPLRYFHNVRTLLLHLWMGLCPITELFQTSFTMSAKPSRCNQPNSNLNCGLFTWSFVAPMPRSNGAWLESASIRSTSCIVTIWCFAPHFVSISKQSSFSYVVTGLLFTQVNRPHILISLRSKYLWPH